MKFVNKTSLIIFSFGILAISFSFWTYLQAGNEEIVVCVNRAGLLRLIDATETCRRTEIRLSWNKQGPQGERGSQGPPGASAFVLPENLKPTTVVNKQFCFIPTGSGLRHITAKWDLENKFGIIPSNGISLGTIYLTPTNGGRMSFIANGTSSELTTDVKSALVGFEGIVEFDANVFWGNFQIPVSGSTFLTIDFDARGCRIMDGNISSTILQDNFNGYTNGSIVGQGGWSDRVNGGNFMIQGAVTFEGAKALHNTAQADSVITKIGTSLADGRQAVYVRTENRSGWGFYPHGNAGVRLSKGGWDSFPMVAVTFKPDGHTAYYDVITSEELGRDVYTDFATYNDNEWTLVEIEWRSSDRKARYRANEGIWTDWKTFRGATSFTDFDTVGFGFIAGGSGGVYFDTLR